MEYYIEAIRNSFDFEGEATVIEYWMFALIHCMMLILLFFIAYLAPTGVKGISSNIFLLYSVFMSVPWISIAIRRLHDTGKSGSWYFIIFIPIVGWVWLFILLCKN